MMYAHIIFAQVALIWEADEPGHSKRITYRQLLEQVCRLSLVLLSKGVKKGDTVAIYMPSMCLCSIFMLLDCNWLMMDGSGAGGRVCNAGVCAHRGGA